MTGFLDNAPRFLFFTGKGGVGKTSLAAATAVRLAEGGHRVLLVSTDPASNLDDVLGTPLGQVPTAVGGAPNLWGLNIDPEEAARQYRERVVGPYRDTLPADAVVGMEEQLSGACTVEVAAFDEFTGLLTGDAAAEFDHVIFDTAPTGHTLRLLRLPAAWTAFLDSNERGASCLGPASGLTMQRERYRETVAALADPARTRVILVARPETGALEEAARTGRELAALGLRNQHLVLNGVFRATDRSDPLAVGLEASGRAAVAGMPGELRDLPRSDVALRGENVVGLAAVRLLLAPSPSPDAAPAGADAHLGPGGLEAGDLGPFVDQLATRGRGLVMVMGKGGVGKTTIASALAVELAARGVAVHLATTDPAAHVAETVGDGSARQRISRIDPEAEVAAYRRKVQERVGATLDEEGRALLEEDLRSPCTEEVAVFHAFSRLVSAAAREVVIMDTAPTGHTLLLLDAAGSYHWEILRHAAGTRGRITTPLMRLQDAEYTKILLVTLAETTPVLEAAALADDLRRAGIEPYAWIVNNSLAAAGPRDGLLVRRAVAERDQIAKVRGLAARVYVTPRLPAPPIGAAALRGLVGGNGRPAARIA
ncbi:MAG: arsenical pump-driving ATPase [Gemmatimonadetes bacterium]|nr:arsenical pump-driving ATPase [Gemmatimonadota bacterium]